MDSQGWIKRADNILYSPFPHAEFAYMDLVPAPGAGTTFRALVLKYQ